MSTIRMFLSVLKSVSGPRPARRCGRTQRQPCGEPLEPRALLSNFKGGLPTAGPSGFGSPALVINVNQASSFKVSYQANHEGALRVAGPAGSTSYGGANQAAIATEPSNLGTAVESDVVDQIDVENDVVDQINVENDVVTSP